jgi:prepilin-type N-terminal cleavage/methylation domain-containing protein
MAYSMPTEKRVPRRRHPGFSLVELLVVLVIVTTISGIVLTVIFRMSATQGSISNRTEMHSGVRSATEVLEQEIGQAGRVSTTSLPTAPATLSAAVLGDGLAHTVGVTPAAALANMFIGEVVVVGPDATNPSACPGTATKPCASREAITLTGVDTVGNTITAIFNDPHAAGSPLQVQGVFPSGIVPPGGNNITAVTSTAPYPVGVVALTGTDAAPGTGSDGYHLKLYGDINGDGNLSFVEYDCITGTQAAPGNLYRKVLAWNAASKPTVDATMVLLPNIIAWPTATPVPCFSYQTQIVGNDTYVTDVAVTLTVQTQGKDPQRKVFDLETKALLNVSPRNVFEGWQIASLPANTSTRIQPMPKEVVNLLPYVAP